MQQLLIVALIASSLRCSTALLSGGVQSTENAPTTKPPCTDAAEEHRDAFNDDCSYYTAKPAQCGKHDKPDGSFTAAKMCCACGGGNAPWRPHKEDLDPATGKKIEVPPWKVDLIAGKKDDWWETYGAKSVDRLSSSWWGKGLPAITGSPGQNHQRCPVLKLPDRIMMAAKGTSWTSLYGAWQTPEAVTVALWDQNYLGMGFGRNIKRVSVNIRAPSTGRVAARTKYFTNAEMITLFNWKEPITGSGLESTITNKTALREDSLLDTEEIWNLAIFDCEGTLMYVVKHQTEFPRYLKIYSRDGFLLTESFIGTPILKYSFLDPKTGYLIGSAEAPGLNANMTPEQIPAAYKTQHIIPFGMKFEEGGYVNESYFVEPEYRWVLAAAIQSLTIFQAPQDTTNDVPWNTLTVIETIYYSAIVSVLVLLVLAVLGTYHCVYPTGEAEAKDLYGKIADNPFLAAQNIPPPRTELYEAAKARASYYGENFQGYGTSDQ